MVAIQRCQCLLNRLAGLDESAQVVIGGPLVKTNSLNSLTSLEYANPVCGTLKPRNFIVSEHLAWFGGLGGVFFCHLGLGF